MTGLSTDVARRTEMSGFVRELMSLKVVLAGSNTGRLPLLAIEFRKCSAHQGEEQVLTPLQKTTPYAK